MTTVLLINDDDDIAQLVRSLLQARGMTVLDAHDESTVEKQLREFPADVVVIDSDIRSATSLHLINVVRSLTKVPIVLLTEASLALRCLPSLDLPLVFSKPIDVNDFAERIMALVPTEEAEVLSDLTAQLADLRKVFADALPSKLDTLSEAVSAAQMDPAHIEVAHMLAHRLHGSAGSYGFEAVGHAAAGLEDLLADVFENRQLASQNAFWESVRSALQDTRMSANRAPELEAIAPGVLIGRTRAILVVDDDPDFLRLVKANSRALMIDVVTAQTPQEALQYARTRPFVAALLDVHLGPNTNAFELAKEIRRTPQNESLRIAFVSGDGAMQTRVSAIEAGASKFLEKTTLNDSFATTMEAFLKSSADDRGRVIVVEDDADTREMYMFILEQAGYSVSGLECADVLVETLEEKGADLLLLDVNLPRLSGVDVCRALRMSERWGLLPILIITSLADARLRVNAYRAGASDVMSKPVLPEELVARADAQMERARLLRDRADKDGLSGLMSRRALLENFQRVLGRCKRELEPLALVFLDIDRFKMVNDTRGHLAGDRVIARLGELMRQRYRVEDLRGRWGGEEFALVFPGQEREFATHAAENLLREFSRIPFYSDDGTEFYVTFTAGISGYPDDGESLEALFRCADDRLYAGKRSGRNRIMGAGSLTEVSEIWDAEEGL